MNKKIGFCCKFKCASSIDPKQAIEIEKEFNTKTTTVTAIEKLSEKDMFKKLEPLVQHNLSSTFKLLEYSASLPKDLQMLRLSSEILPLRTHESTKKFWKNKNISNLIESELNKIGVFAKNNEIRIGFHPGQFCVLNSNNSVTLKNSIEEFEYHVDLARMMGFSKWHENGFFINVHVGGKQNGTEQLIKNLKLLSKEAINLITIENDEYSFGVDECLRLKDHLALVLDIHHHWCKTGEYIQPDDKRIDEIVASWKGIRPLIHYSVSPEKMFECEPNTLPNLSILKAQGFKIKDLRIHSKDYWNQAVNKWAYSFLDKFDIELECKNKNQASLKFLKEFKFI